MKKKNIALAFSMGARHLEQSVLGIKQYINEFKCPWRLITNPETHKLEISELKNLKIDGVIAMIRSERDEKIIQELKLPTINISGVLDQSLFPRVCSDSYLIGKKGAEYLRSRGFRSFAFYGLQGIAYSKEMYQGFCSAISDSSPQLLELPPGANFMTEDEMTTKFLKSLPKPCAIMASHDPRALILAQTCEEIGLKVPEDIAILGCNNDSVSCELASPQLSSVERQDREVGFAAALKLDTIMRGEAPKNEDLIAPKKIIERASTNIITAQNPEMRKAVSFIQKQAKQSLSVQMVCDHLGRSRRWLEYAFREEFSKSPKEFIDELKLQNARELLLTNPELKLAQVASSCGFASLDQMNQLFMKKLGKRAIFFKK